MTSKNILYLDTKVETDEMNPVSLESVFDCQVIQKYSAKDAVVFLTSSKSIDLIISSGEDVDLLKYVQSQLPNTPFIQADKIENKLHEAVSEALTLKQDAISDYRRIKAERFLSFNSIACDIFLQLSEGHYVCIMRENQIYSSDVIQKYQKKGVAYLYVRENNFVKVCRDLLMPSKLDFFSKADTTKVEIFEQLTVAKSVREHFVNAGFDATVVEMMDNVLNSSVSQLKKNPALFDLLIKIKNGGTYISEHSTMASYITAAIARKMEWTTDSTLKKLGMAALLHDATFTNEQLAKITSLQSEAAQKLNPAELLLIRNHPFEIAEKVRSLKDFYPDVDVIIQQHHETPEGDGFPRGLSPSQIAPMSCMFIIAEDFANILYELKGNINDEMKKEIMSSFKKKYSHGNFVIPLMGFLKTINVT